MSKLPLAPIFSAAHISKWDALPEDTLLRVTESRLELERMTRSSVNDTAHDMRAPETSVFPTSRACKTTSACVVAGKSDKAYENMATKTYTWITLWFLLTAPVILWDATYCFFRPRSMVGGDLHWIWAPYAIYQDIDYVYGLKALEENNGFTNAQSLLNLVETALNLVYVYLAHVSSWPGAPLIGFAAATMTLSKTVLYWAQEYYCGGCAIGHNTWDNLLLYWVLPNGFWLVFPSMIVWRLGGDIIGSLFAASPSARRTASGKTE